MSDKPMPAFRSIAAPLDVDDSALDRFNEKLGVPSMTRPQSPVATVAPVPVRAPLEKLTLELPGYLAVALRRDAAERRMSARHIVMLALKDAGYAIDDADLVPDGRRARGKSVKL